MKIYLFFEINGNFRQYSTHEYKIVERQNTKFYEFTDLIDGKFRSLHKSLYRGKEVEE